MSNWNPSSWDTISNPCSIILNITGKHLRSPYLIKCLDSSGLMSNKNYWLSVLITLLRYVSSCPCLPKSWYHVWMLLTLCLGYCIDVLQVFLLKSEYIHIWSDWVPVFMREWSCQDRRVYLCWHWQRLLPKDQSTKVLQPQK